MTGQKRSFPYYSSVSEIDLKRRAVEGVNPGEEAADANIYEAPTTSGPRTLTAATDFRSWTDKQLQEFLDQRGEDRDDCSTRDQLIQRARECEYTTGPAKKPPEASQEAETEDALDAFMAEMQQLEKEQQQQQQPKRPSKADLDEEEDNVADFMEARARNAAAARVFVADGYNSDDEVYATDRAMQEAAGGDNDESSHSRQVGPLAALDHDSIDYQPFAKDFYTPLPEIASMPPAQVSAMRRQLGIRVSGFDAPGPVESFAQCRLGPTIMAVIKKAGFEKPTAIQAQALPAALSGRDILGIAKTGSGKTVAFVIPMVVHIQDQAELDKGEGPIGVIVAPTRELAEQIHREARRFGKPFGMRIAAGIGGLSKLEQFKDLKAGSDAAVCTPGRLIDLIKMKACTLLRTTFLVFDEADRMFDMGFEPQVRSIIGQVRPDRQTMLFSATMPTKVESLVRDALSSPVRITVGEVGAANEDIRQVVEIIEEKNKLSWLLGKLPAMVDEGEVLVFAGQISRVEEVVQRMKAAGHRCVAIHGDMDQHSRAAALRDFSAGRQHVLVATDVAARGLDIKSIKTVVNLDSARDIDTHVHRVGRTGRAGDKDGTAWTLLDPREARFAGILLNSMVAANQEISTALQALAMKDPRFRKGQSRNKAGGKFSAAGAKRRQQVGGAGIGFGPAREDPMLELYGDRQGFAKPAAPSDTGAGASAKAAPSGFVASSSLGVKSLAPQPPLPPPPPGPAPEPGPPPEEPPGSGGVFGGQGLKGIMQNRFRNQFVTSGTTGGDIGQKATIIAPKQPKPAPQPAEAPSFLAKKMSAQGDQAQQAIAAARAIAARLAGGGAAAAEPAQPPQQPPAAPQSFRGGGRGHGQQHRNLPPGMGASAAAYPDLSRDDGGSVKDSLAEERRSEARSYREPPRQSHTGRGSGAGLPAASTSNAPYQSVYGGQQPQHQPPPWQQAPRPQSTGPPQPYSQYGSAQPTLLPQPYNQYGSAQPTPPQSYGQYGSAQPTPPQPYSRYSSQPAAMQQPCSQYGSSQPAAAAPQPAAAGSNPSIQASIAAAQAIAARLSAQAGAPSAQPSQGRLGSVNVNDSVQASIEAARAVAARFAAKDGGASQLGNQQPSNAGQWAWGKG